MKLHPPRQTLRVLHRNDKNIQALDIAVSKRITIDEEKLRGIAGYLPIGITNHALFQKYASFRWPLWVRILTAPEESATCASPLLVNNAMRDYLFFTNLLSFHGLRIDPTGMISPSYARWSLETWLLVGETIVRPADDRKRVKVERDVNDATVVVSWDAGVCTVKQTIYGARSDIDEAIVETECVLRDRREAVLLFAARPYDLIALGGINTVEIDNGGIVLTVNGARVISFTGRPDTLFSSGKDSCRDILPSDRDRREKSCSEHGMATMAVGYGLKKGDQRFIARISLDPRGGITPGAFDMKRAREDFVDFAAVRLKNGSNMHLPDRELQAWWYGLKNVLLNVSARDIAGQNGRADFRKAHRVIMGMNRAGYFPESLKLIDYCFKQLSFESKRFSFDEIMDASHLIESAADYFIHVRDIGFLRNRFESLSRAAEFVIRHTKAMIKTGKNAMEEYLLADDLHADRIFVAHALAQHAYLARCLGIFGEEIRFTNESNRIAERAIDMAFGALAQEEASYGILHTLLAAFPFRLDAITADYIRALLMKIKQHFGNLPVYRAPLGWDVALSFSATIALLYLNDASAIQLVRILCSGRGKTYSFPDYMNPVTGCATWGEGSSCVAAAMACSALRHILFIDYPERLELFPVPPPEWFQPGKTIEVDEAASRFGPISFKTTVTENEVQIYLTKLPKFVPPEIKIHLPYKSKIKKEDDFVVKREHGTFFIINGWPSCIRFMRD